MSHQLTLHVSQIRDILERHDANGERIPVSIHYACMNGGEVNITDKSVVCIGCDPRHRRHTLKFSSGEIRTVHDVLIFRVNDTKIVVS